MLDRYPGEVIILDPAGQWEDGEWPAGAYRNPKSLNAWIDEVTNEGRGPPGPRVGEEGALLVLDDADRYLPQWSAGNPWRDVWLANRHLRLDVIVTAHRPQGVPKDLLEACAELWLFALHEPLALDYLSRVPSLASIFRSGEHPLPTRPGQALRVVKASGDVQRVKLF